MCENWGFQPAYVGRRKRGWSVQDALTIPVMKTDDMHKVIEIVEQYEPEDVIRAISEYKERHGFAEKEPLQKTQYRAKQEASA